MTHNFDYVIPINTKDGKRTVAAACSEILITRRDRALNMTRLNAIAFQPTLFGKVSVISSWRRIVSGGRMKLETFLSPPAAGHQVAALERRKWRRGYG